MTLYRFNQGGSYYRRGLKWEQGAELIIIISNLYSAYYKKEHSSPRTPLTLTTEFKKSREH